MKERFLPFQRQDFVRIAVLILVYFVVAKFGLAISSVNKFAALIWPPTGISLAALMIFGIRLWPAIFIAAFAVNFTTGAPVAAALGIAIGNTLEGIVGAYLCSVQPDFEKNLATPRSVGCLVGRAAVLSTLISASFGVGSLYYFTGLPASELQITWMQWWVGDAVANLAIAPLLLVFYFQTHAPRLSWRAVHFAENFAIAFALLFLCLLIFSPPAWIELLTGVPGLYMLVPILLWSAIRYGQRGSSVATFIVASFAIWSTASGAGPFTHGPFTANLMHLMVFVVTMSITGLFVGAIVTQREVERELLRNSEHDLREAKNAADSANVAKSTFLANMSHEIRTPLGAVLGFSELVADDTVSGADKASYVSAIKRSGELLSNIINDILDLSKIEAGKMTVQLREVALIEILKDVKAMAELQAEEKGVRFQLLQESPLPLVLMTDPQRVRQILINIIGNALKFTEEGSVTLTVKMDASARPSVLFLVQDTGKGISPADADKLFKPFTQVDASAKRRFGGTGLGLVLSKRFANMLGGDVKLVRSEMGVGSTFCISIDPGPMRAQILSGAKSKDLPQTFARLDHIRVLLADDSEDNRAMITKFLTMAGADVDIAENGSEALEKAKAASHDIVLMDLQMPVMDGYAATSELRKSGYTGKIVALTAHALLSERQRCLANGFDDHISKPFTRNALITRVSELCSVNRPS